MPILTSDGKQIEKRYTSDGKNVRTVYNSNGDIVFEEIDTAEGALPQTFKSRGKPLVNYRIYGETIQNGTPTPEKPVEVQGCGVRTENGYKLDITINGANLFDSTTVLKKTFLRAKQTEASSIYGEYNTGAGWNSSDFIRVFPNTSYTVTYPTIKSALVAGIVFYSERSNDSAFGGISIDDQGVVLKYTFTTPANCNYVRFSYPNTNGNNCTFTNTPLTTPVYIGQSPIYKIGDYADYVDYKRGGVVRRIKELVLTGEENWKALWGVLSLSNQISAIATPRIQTLICDRYVAQNNLMAGSGYPAGYGNNSITFRDYASTILIRDGAFGTDTTSYKAFLAAQYAAGTPVTIYYVLATPEFEPVSDLAKIPTFAPQTVIDADMTIKPSKIWYKYKP